MRTVAAAAAYRAAGILASRQGDGLGGLGWAWRQAAQGSGLGRQQTSVSSAGSSWRAARSSGRACPASELARRVARPFGLAFCFGRRLPPRRGPKILREYRIDSQQRRGITTDTCPHTASRSSLRRRRPLPAAKSKTPDT
eukprot:scaffold53855_cov55-Phaeocystis_antarctica.AAC.5